MLSHLEDKYVEAQIRQKYLRKTELKLMLRKVDVQVNENQKKKRELW